MCYSKKMKGENLKGQAIDMQHYIIGTLSNFHSITLEKR